MDLNSTISQASSMISYDKASLVIQSKPILIALSIAWGLPLLLYLIVGLCVHARTFEGRKTNRLMITSPNFLWALLIFGFIEACLIVLVIFPVWLNIFN